MKDSWLTSRRDVILRDIIRYFFEAKTTFDKINKKYLKLSFVPFKIMDLWIGTDTRKGPLWNLKDLCHRLFRNNDDSNNMYEYFFDWTMGSIYHEAIKVKEDSYQVESYKPLLNMQVDTLKKDKALSKIIGEYFSLIEKANKNLKDDLLSIEELFTKAVFHLREIIILNSYNVLLLRFLLDNKKTFGIIFGKNTLADISNKMFSSGLCDMYLHAADNSLSGGWYEKAEEYIKEAINLEPENKTAHKLIKQLKKREE